MPGQSVLRESYHTEAEALKAVADRQKQGDTAWLAEKYPEIGKFVVIVVRKLYP